MEKIRELFERELQSAYFSEKELLEALKDLAAETRHDELKDIFQGHEEKTREHLRRLEEVFRMLGLAPKEIPSEGAMGLVEDKKQFSLERPSTEVLMLFNVSVAIKAQRFEISSYESMAGMASALGLHAAEGVLRATLDEEEEALKKLLVFAEKNRIAGTA